MEQTQYPIRRFSFVKILAAVLFIVLPFVGFWLGMEYEQFAAGKKYYVAPSIMCLVINYRCSDGFRSFANIIGCGCEIGISNQNQPLPVIISPTPTPDETAGWKTYRNEEYGFEFRYPNEWEFFPLGLDNTFYFGEEYFPDSMFHVWIDDNKPEPGEGDCMDITIDSQLGTMCTWRRHIDSTHGVTVDYYLTVFQVMIPFNNSYYQMSYAATDDILQEKSETFDQILSSFRFVEEENQ